VDGGRRSRRYRGVLARISSSSPNRVNGGGGVPKKAFCYQVIIFAAQRLPRALPGFPLPHHQHPSFDQHDEDRRIAKR